MIGKKFRAIRDILFEELFQPIEEDNADKEGTVYIPIGTEGKCTKDWGDGYIGMILPDSIRNPYDSTVPAHWLTVPADAFEEVKE